MGQHHIPKTAIPGLSKPSSSMALGLLEFDNLADVSAVLDRFSERGGNLLDTAFAYRDGLTEKLVGAWISERGVREEIALVGKGAHTPLCTPENIGKQLTRSLERLQTDYVDIYFMHRDNLDVPVAEFVDAMDAEVRAGRIRGTFGGSNWTRERFDEAVAYAAKSGKQAPGVLSNNFSLGEMQDVIWPGCISSSDETWHRWFLDRKVPNFAWSSQARGFFSDRAGRDKLDDEEMVSAWYSDRNFTRRDRAMELANQVGKSGTQVALAYALAQPFPLIPIIGPGSLAELEDSLAAFEIQLTREQVTWLKA
ncbi:aldo/keto reductase [Agrobacterium vitis]|uniref:NADP-dependent oxidoreductase domain-containing protein n=1 Tax=Agrobacterium vitis TaxID=373 RepID=A0AAE4WEA4_AGRVI|nr:aldo/keto reductase [Allorhizobium sp. Av2]MCM2442225.1 aldo/keto reductase [Agrobacterium vitis]MUZ58635.1 hypothetical protein [Agrobacterium vitis]MVA66270.1 hypothetical protein [Agrobacterium vitis]MVA88307.1 hypothetical protein [Agrobacterium vitis]